MKVYSRNIIRIFLVAALAACVMGCVNFNQVKVTGVDVGSITPTGLKSINGVVKIGVRNDSKAFTVSDLEGRLYKSGTQIGELTADPVTVEGKTSKTYEVPAVLAISNISIMQLLSIVKNPDLDEFTVDLTVKIKPKGGAAKTLKFKDVPLKQLINTAKTYGV